MSGLVAVNAALLQAMPLPPPAAHADKNSRGTVLVAGGSRVSAGAVMLSGTAAFRAGAGKVQLLVPQSLAVAVGVAFPEAGVHAFADAEGDAASPPAQLGELLQRTDAALIGPGFIDESLAHQFAADALTANPDPAFVIDAMSLTALWDQQRMLHAHRGRVVLTPHAGEMAQLAGATRAQVEAEPLRFAQLASSHLQCVVVLKGATTLIAQPDGPAYQHVADLAALATSGSGDVLAGLLAGLLSRGTAAVEAAVWSVYLHAQAGRLLAERMGPLGLMARELPAQIPPLMRDLSAAGRRGPQT